MKMIKECATLTMTTTERDDLRAHLGVLHDHAEAYLKTRGDVESGTPDAKLMDAMHRVYDFYRLLNAGEYA